MIELARLMSCAHVRKQMVPPFRMPSWSWTWLQQAPDAIETEWRKPGEPQRAASRAGQGLNGNW